MGYLQKGWDFAKGASGYNLVKGAYDKVSDPGKAQREAAAAGRQASGQYQDLANQMWGRSMEGLGQAQSAYGGARDYADYFNTQQRDPSGTEQGAQQWQRWLDTYTNPQQDAYAGWQKYMDFNPQTKSSQALTAASQALGGETQAGALWKDLRGDQGPVASSQLYGSWDPNRTSDTSQWWDTMRGRLAVQGEGEGALSEITRGLANPGSYEHWVLQNSGRYGKPNALDQYMSGGAAEAYGDIRAGQLNLSNQLLSEASPEAREAAMLGVAARYGGEGALRTESGDIRDIYDQAINRQGWADVGLGQLAGPSMSESWATQSLGQANPYYDRLRDQGLARINQSMAARGHSRSGGAAQAEGNFLAATNAEQAKAMSDLVNQADQARLGRLGLGGTLSSQADTGALERGVARQGLATGLESEWMGRQKQMEAERAQREAEALGSRNLALQAKSAAATGLTQQGGLEAQRAAQQLAAIQAESQAARGAQELALQRQNIRGNQAAAQQAAQAQRLALGLQGSQAADNEYRAYQEMLLRGAGQADTTKNAWANTQITGARTADEQARANQNTLLQGAGQADNQDTSRYTNWMNLATAKQQGDYNKIAQSMNLYGAGDQGQRQRYADIMGREMGLAGANASNLANFYNMGLGAYGGQMGSSIGAQLSAAQMQAMAQNAPWDMAMQLANLGASYGGMKGGAAGGAPNMMPTAGQTGYILGNYNTIPTSDYFNLNPNAAM